MVKRGLLSRIKAKVSGVDRIDGKALERGQTGRELSVKEILGLFTMILKNFQLPRYEQLPKTPCVQDHSVTGEG